MKVVLLTERGDRFVDPPLELIQQVLVELTPTGDNAFAILERGPSYVQTVRGHNGFHVEQREAALVNPDEDFTHYKAGRPDGSMLAADLELEDTTLEGHANELLQLHDAVISFTEFWEERPRHHGYRWRVMAF
jgi:hypothetical protein